MKWIKAPEELKLLLEGAIKDIACEKRPMFGYPAYFINKNMFAGLFQDKLFVRLAEPQLKTLHKTYPAIANLEPMPGRPMKDYFELPSSMYEKRAELIRIVQMAAEFTRTLAPKVSKPTKKERT